MINVKLKDGSIREIEDHSNIYELTKSLSNNLAKSAVVGEVNGRLADLNYKLKNNDEVNILTIEDEKAIEVMRHSTSHVMAQAVKRVFKDVKLAIGPSIENGFYYDFDIEEPLTLEDLNKIEKEMNNIITENLSFERVDISREESLKLMNERGESYKVELINDLPEGEKIRYKIREARNERVPYIIIVGEKEENDKNISLRSRENGDEGSVELDSFINRICNSNILKIKD